MKNERLTAVFTLISSTSLFPCFFNTKCVRVYASETTSIQVELRLGRNFSV